MKLTREQLDGMVQQMTEFRDELCKKAEYELASLARAVMEAMAQLQGALVIRDSSDASWDGQEKEVIGNGHTASDARMRWGDPNQERNEVERACPWCASWLINKGKGEPSFEHVVECGNLMCPLLPTGGCYWEPWPDGWTDENVALQAAG